ncbi:MAG TPA: LuxR C-terminal-related transcriptional regulator [Thermoanaerobaculia bacterium]|nr:LuxR C-terminal-related transcriptional regulator [Thermoanaerobaculia bacterium]
MRSARSASQEPEGQWDYYHEVLRAGGIVDRLYCGAPLAPRAEVVLALDRGAKDRPFGARESELLLATAHATRGLLRRSLLAHGLIETTAAFSRREREVFRELLGGDKEPEIARRLGLSPNTLHHYVVALCTKLGVRGRTGLMALALRGGGPVGGGSGPPETSGTPTGSGE